MSRPSTAEKRKKELLPLIAAAFSELGYRRATTAEIAARCSVQETILYRIWDDKKAMFLASIDYLFQYRLEHVREVLDQVPPGEDALSALTENVASSLGEMGLYRIIFAALGELHDTEIRQALGELYRHNHRLVVKLLANRQDGRTHDRLKDQETAWAVLGMATIMNITTELELLGPRQRKAAFTQVAGALLELPAE
jgi:AcrR family transcriptional regulator